MSVCVSIHVRVSMYFAAWIFQAMRSKPFIWQLGLFGYGLEHHNERSHFSTEVRLLGCSWQLCAICAIRNGRAGLID